MARVRRARSTVALLLLCGCAQQGAPACTTIDDPLTQIVATEAWLEDVSLSHTAAFVGPASGHATLAVVDEASDRHDFAATLDGVEMGAVLRASAALTLDGAFPFEIEPGALTARELLGSYDGPMIGADVVLGVTWRRLENDAGAVLVLAGPSLGLGVAPLAYEQVELSLDEDPLANAQ